MARKFNWMLLILAVVAAVTVPTYRHFDTATPHKFVVTAIDDESVRVSFVGDSGFREELRQATATSKDGERFAVTYKRFSPSFGAISHRAFHEGDTVEVLAKPAIPFFTLMRVEQDGVLKVNGKPAKWLSSRPSRFGMRSFNKGRGYGRGFARGRGFGRRG